MKQPNQISNYKTNQNALINLEKGKIPPQAIDLEEVVLGALMIQRSAIDEVVEFLKPEVFYKEAHQKIYEAISQLFQKDEVIDLLTVSTQLKSSKHLDLIGGDFYLISLTQKVSSSAHIEFHARVILQKYIKREIIKNANVLIEESYNETTDTFEILDGAYLHLDHVSEVIVSNKSSDIKDITKSIIDEGGKIYRKEIKPGIETPIDNLTKKMGGWRNTELIILAGRPGMGKTSFVLKAGWHAALNNIPTAFFSLEMSDTKLMQRIWSMECRIDGNKFNVEGLSPEDQQQIINREKELGEVPFYIDDTPSLNIQKLRVRAKKLVKNYNIKLIIIDYLQLMQGEGKTREQDVAKISRGLKSLAMELNIPVIALSQLSRAVETRGGSKRPLLSDLRESGAIEQDADVVGFFYRPEYYNLEYWDDYDGVSCKGEAEYIIAKNRNGGLVRNRMKFEAKYTLFNNINYRNWDDVLEDTDFKEVPKGTIKDAFAPVKNELNGDDDMPF